MTERRTARRYDLSLSVVIRAPSRAKGIQHQGTTRDISTRGVYLVLNRAISRDTDIDLHMVLPTGYGGTRVLVRAVGRVVRLEEWLEETHRRAGVATVIRRYEIVRVEPGTSAPKGF
jgi:c-di-GMP-binding flagellar brake protein YcgR